jgi:hypothetical protein
MLDDVALGAAEIGIAEHPVEHVGRGRAGKQGSRSHPEILERSTDTLPNPCG